LGVSRGGKRKEKGCGGCAAGDKRLLRFERCGRGESVQGRDGDREKGKEREIAEWKGRAALKDSHRIYLSTFNSDRLNSA
jgi:hypothetical protein